mgnify:CR=1 FL=1
MSVKLKSGNVFYSIHKEYKNEYCTICRQSLNCDSIYAKDENYVSSICMGKCGHSFHQECITPWLKHNNKCPICAK